MVAGTNAYLEEPIDVSYNEPPTVIFCAFSAETWAPDVHELVLCNALAEHGGSIRFYIWRGDETPLHSLSVIQDSNDFKAQLKAAVPASKEEVLSALAAQGQKPAHLCVLDAEALTKLVSQFESLFDEEERWYKVDYHEPFNPNAQINFISFGSIDSSYQGSFDLSLKQLECIVLNDYTERGVVRFPTSPTLRYLALGAVAEKYYSNQIERQNQLEFLSYSPYGSCELNLTQHHGLRTMSFVGSDLKGLQLPQTGVLSYLSIKLETVLVAQTLDLRHLTQLKKLFVFAKKGNQTILFIGRAGFIFIKLVCFFQLRRVACLLIGTKNPAIVVLAGSKNSVCMRFMLLLVQ